MFSSMNRLILCADDFGIAPGVDAGICRLIEEGRLSAVSCMVGGPDFAKSVSALKACALSIDVGVHLTLTDQIPLIGGQSISEGGRFFPLGRLWRQALLGRIDREELESEIGGQLDAFEALVGRAPDFLDGHHHVHQIPIINEVVLTILRKRYAQDMFFVRCTAENPVSIVRRGVDVIKSLSLALPGLRMKALAHNAHMPTNNGFSGIYDFSGKVAYRDLFQRFLSNGGDRMMIMCHPGYSDSHLAELDRVTIQRESELTYFLSDDFSADLYQANFRLARFGATSIRR